MFRENNDMEDLNEMHQKISNQNFDSFEERKDEINKSKNVFVGAVAGITLAAIVGWLVLSPRYDNGSEAEIPVVRRPQTMVKLQPTDPGGMEILNQDKTVYDIIEKKGDDTQTVESILPPPEEPKPIEIAEVPTVEENNIPVVEEEIEMVQQVDEIEPEAVKVAEVKIEETKPEPVKKEEKVDLPKKVDTIKAVEAQEPAKKYSFDEFKQVNPANPGRYVIDSTESSLPDVSDSEFEAEMKPKKTIAVSSATSASKGNWQVQLMSSQNKTAVEASWKTQVAKHNVLSGQPYEIETADLGEKGIYYRLKAGAFTNKAAADSLCSDVKASGGSCIVTQKK